MLLTLKSLSADASRNDINEEGSVMVNNGSALEDRSEESQEGPVNANDEDSEHVAPKWLKGYTINNKIRVARINYYGHILRSDHDGILKSALEHKIDKPKKKGRPPYTWRTCIRQDVERSGQSLQHWQEIAMDRSKMKEQTKKLYDTMVESEYEVDSESDWDSDISSLAPSVFHGFSDEEAYEGSE